MEQAGLGSEAEAGPNPKAPAGLKPIRRRNRMINSKTSPSCVNCLKAGRDCLYIGPRLDEASQLRLAEIKEKQGSLERQLERDVAKSAAATTQKHALGQRILADEIGDEDADEERYLESTPLAALDLTYEDDADGADDMIDLGIQIGRMRITERIGGLSRPRISEEISAGLSGQYRSHGGTPRSPFGVPLPSGPSPALGPPTGLDSMSDGGASDISMPDFLRPGAQYIAPTSGLFFSQVIEQPSLSTFLPCREYADRFFRQYFLSVHPIATCAQRASLEETYAAFWNVVNEGYFEPRASTQAIVFAALFSGAVAMDENDAVRELGGFAKENWVHSLKMGTETALSKANFLRTTKMETMQAFIIYMLPLCRAEVSRAHSVLVGAAVRMAECMGLHRDGEAYGLTPLETHVRRLVWHQLCFLDIRTCEAQGPKPVIRREDYDTKLPVNCNEDQLTHAVVPPEPADHWTTNTLALIRFEVNEMMRIIWLDRRRLEVRKISLTDVLSKIENFRRRMSEKYDHLLDVAQPAQRYARCVMSLLTYRLHAMVLHPYHSNAAHPMPAQLSSLLVSSGIVIVEHAIQLETNPPLPALGLIQGKTAVYMRLRKMRGPTNTARAALAQNVVAGTAKQPSSSTPFAAAATTAGYQHQHHQTQQQQQIQQAQPPQQQHAPSASSLFLHGSNGPKAEVADRHTPPVPQPQHAGAVPMHHQPPPPPQPQPPMEFAGVSDGQVLYSLPPNHESPGSSDTSSVGHAQTLTAMGGVEGSNAAAAAAAAAGAPLVGTALPTTTVGGSIMDTIDWDTMTMLFPQDPQTGAFSIQGYNDPNSLLWMGLIDGGGGAEAPVMQ
ncbi:fungal specific transcription factor domain-containing protein [Apiospora aurea]|uniref:Fungal specific transcription factor domain-containing protein n=1 Tax=Apiospora aurea TaxID=335848 RepID=A0ABR1QDZ1_9PEZI